MVFISCKSSIDFWYEGSINYFLLFITAFLTMFFCFTVYYTKYALLALILLFILPKPLYIVNMIMEFVRVSPDILNDVYDSGYILIKYDSYFTIIAIISAVLLTIICYFIAVRWKRALIFIIAGAAMYTTYFYYSGENLELSCSFFMVCGIMLYAFNSYIKKKKYVNQDESVQSGNYALGWLPSILIIMVLTLFLSPYMPNPVRLKSVSKLENLITKLTEGIDGIGTRNGNGNGKGLGYYSVSYTGFQQKEDRLGGPARLNNSVAFKVNSDDRISGTHMRGLIKSNYTGYVWELNSLQGKYETGKELGYDPSLNVNSNIKEIKLTYKIKGINTIFNALYPISISIGNDTINGDENMQLSSPDDIKSGEGYTITIKDYLWDKNSLINAKVDTSKSGLMQYLALPDNISQRVSQLADEITNEYDKPFLKASAIEKYLKDNYPYSLDTSKLPDNKEFVDYFLFNEKKGSCTYFATAMAVMCRIEGIPARYIEGFVMPSGNAKEGIDVLNSDSHAWVELYFNDIGWITFDPTPGHYSNAVDPDSPYAEDDNPEPEVTPDKNNDGEITPTQPQGGPQGGDNTPVGQNEDERRSIPAAIWVISGLLFALIMMRVGMAVYYSKESRKLYYEFFKLTRYGRTVGAAYVPGQSIREYVLTLQKASGVDLEKFLEFYEKDQYAKSETSSEKINNEALNELFKYVVQKKGRVLALRIRISNPYIYIIKRK
jgi:hypothetical protein